MGWRRYLFKGAKARLAEGPEIADTRFSGFQSLALIFAQALNAALQIGFLPAPDG